MAKSKQKEEPGIPAPKEPAPNRRSRRKRVSRVDLDELKQAVQDAPLDEGDEADQSKAAGRWKRNRRPYEKGTKTSKPVGRQSNQPAKRPPSD